MRTIFTRAVPKILSSVNGPYVSRELTSGESDRLLPGQTVSIGSDRVCLPTSSTPLAPVNLLLPVSLINSDQSPCAHFRFRWRSDSIRLRVKTTRLRSGVLDMCVSTALILYLIWRKTAYLGGGGREGGILSSDKNKTKHGIRYISLQNVLHA